MLALAILFLGIVSRLIVHAPNFTPVIALALFGGFYLNRRQAVIVPVALMVASDFLIGWHATIPFTWGSVLLISGLGLWARQRKSAGMIFGTSLFSAIVFFLVTNFGSWLTMYPLTVEGFQTCYLAAIPFFRSTLVSTLVYAGILFGLYEVTASRVKNTRLASILLTT